VSHPCGNRLPSARALNFGMDFDSDASRIISDDKPFLMIIFHLTNSNTCNTT
jgi:hypothetical protein